MIAEPPVLVGAVNVTDTVAFPAVAVPMVGAPGTDAGSKAPMDGGEGLVVPSKSVVGTFAVAVPAAFAGEAFAILRLVDGATNKGSSAMEPVPRVSPVLAAPFTVLPKKRFVFGAAPPAVIAPADAVAKVVTPR